MKFNYNDGGRQAAGFTRKKSGDCVCRAIAIATERPYKEIHALISHYAKQERTGKRKSKRSDPERGVYKSTERKVMGALGWEWVPTMGIGTGCRVHLCDGELPQGRIVANVSHHFTAIIDGVINDTYDPSRGGSRCVYGYYRPTAYALKPSDPLPVTIDAETLTQEQATIDGKRKPHAPRYDREGWLIMPEAQVRRAAESFIPENLRPYYVGCDISTAWAGPLTADNSDIYLYFKKPVIGCTCDDSRYCHGNLNTIAQELDACEVADGLFEEEYEEYDEEYSDRPTKAIQGDPIATPAEREKIISTWRKGNGTRRTAA